MTEQEKNLARKQLARFGLYRLSDLSKINVVWDTVPILALRYLKDMIPCICYGKDCELYMEELKPYTTIYLPLIRAAILSRK